MIVIDSNSKPHIYLKRLRKKIVLSKQRDHDIAELKAAIEFLKKKINTAVVSDPSSGVISNDKGIQNQLNFLQLLA
jgi:hypothetical protein